MYFPAFEEFYDDVDTYQFDVQDDFVQFTQQFRYLGSVISFHLSDTADINARLSQATKAMGALRNYFRCNKVSLHAFINLSCNYHQSLPVGSQSMGHCCKESLQTAGFLH
jgi:hypothetical protein